MDRILIIEDDTEINNMMLEAFTRAGCRCAQAFSGTEALLRMDGGDFDLAVMDLMLPGMSGEQLLPQLKEKQDIPVIVVSAKDGIDTKVGLLESGADDYMTKPFEIRELIARAAVQIRKKNPSGKTGRGLTYGGLSLNEDNYTAEVSGGEIPLTKQEFKILELLMSNPA
jgi:DNA-binding response OmpR family regulator